MLHNKKKKRSDQPPCSSAYELFILKAHPGVGRWTIYQADCAVSKYCQVCCPVVCPSVYAANTVVIGLVFVTNVRIVGRILSDMSIYHSPPWYTINHFDCPPKTPRRRRLLCVWCVCTEIFHSVMFINC